MTQQVLVVGAGPVGLTMAADLARYGVRVRIVDQAAARSDKSKALVLWSRSLELLDRFGAGAPLVAAGARVIAANIMAGRRRVGRIRLDGVASPHPYALMLPQSDTERLLEQQLEAHGVRVEREVTLTGFVPGAQSVAARLRHGDGREEAIEVAWLIGCDGAHSKVRGVLGLAFEGDTLPSDWVLADVHLSGGDLPGDELMMFWHAEGALAIFPIAGDRFRVIADVGTAQGGGHRADPGLAEVQALLDRRGPGGITAADPVWLAAFRINERKVAEYRVGRVFVAGDAAHIHSPAGGQGMNTGMQDACNLAWRLALVCRGRAGSGLLDSYSPERSAVGRQVLRDAGRLTTLAVLKGDVAQAVRNRLAGLVLGFAPVRRAMAETLTELAVGYSDSAAAGGGARAHRDPAAGRRAPIVVDDPVGGGADPRFALFAPAGAEAAALIGRHPDLLEAQPRPPFDDGALWLVRPDGYVACVVGPDGWSGLEAYLDRVVGV